MYEGTLEEEQPYGASFHELGPLSVESGLTDLPGLAPLTVNSIGSVACDYGSSAQRFPIGLIDYNTTALRLVFDYYSNFSAQPEFNNSLWLFEGYSDKGVKDIPENSTAFPHRADNLLM